MKNPIAKSCEIISRGWEPGVEGEKLGCFLVMKYFSKQTKDTAQEGTGGDRRMT